MSPPSYVEPKVPAYGRELYAEQLGARGGCDFDTDVRNVVADPANAATVDVLSVLLRRRVMPSTDNKNNK